VCFDVTGQLLIRYFFAKKWECNEAVYQQCVDFKEVNDSVRREDLCNILMEFGIPLKPVTLIKICLRKPYSRVRVGKYMSDRFPIKNGLKYRHCFSTLLKSMALGGFT
jgi:hypothetical protein